MLGQNAVENNALDRLDGFTPGERSLRARADKIYQNNQKDKDLYIRAYEAYELKASYLAAKEIVVGTWEGIRHPWDNTIVPLVEAVSSPVQTTNKIVMSYENWKAVRDEAYISDPQLAGRMDAMFDARVGANAAFMIVSGGTASAIVRSPAAAKVVQAAGNLTKKGLTLVYINGKLKLGPSSLPSSALKAPVPIVRKAEAPSGKAVPVGEARIPQSPQAVKGTTVTLAQEQRLANGELIPRGSVVTWSDNAVKVVRPDGSKRVFSSRDWEQKALPKPSLSSLANLTSKEQKVIRYLARDNGKIIVNGEQIPVNRLPQDINVKPTPPSPLNGSGRTIGKSKSQNQIMQDDVAYLRSMGAKDIRINQQQVNNQMCRVGICRPDVQDTLRDSNKRIYIEYDRASSNRGAGHASRALSNDPDAIVILRTVD